MDVIKDGVYLLPLSKQNSNMKLFPICRIAGLGLVLMLGLTACYPGDSLTVSELDIVSTDHDPEYFAANNPTLYFMPDTVTVIGTDDPQYAFPREVQQFILDEIESNFSRIGYTRTLTPNDNVPDVLVLVSAVNTQVNVGGCIPWWPGWGWGGWWPGWGWGGPGYCYPTYLYSYSTGTLLVDMLPQQQDDEDLERVWNAGFNGLARSSDAANANAVSNALRQAFDQSPYLVP